MSYEDNKAMARTYTQTEAGDHTMSHQGEEILCSQRVMKLWQRLSREAERLSVSLKKPEYQWPVQLSSVLLLIGQLEERDGEAREVYS